MTNIHIDVQGQSEDALQQKCVFWFHNTYPLLRGLLFAVPNGGDRGGKQGKILRLTGVVSGVSDLILLYSGSAFMIELKKDDTKLLQKNQKAWRDKVQEQGFIYLKITSLASFKTIIKTLIN